MTSTSELTKQFYQNDIIKFGNFILKSGQNAPYYINMRNSISNPQLFDELTTFIVDYLKRNKFDINRIAGVPLGGIPFATAIAAKMNLPLIMPRKTKKDYGMNNEIEGKMEIGDDILLIEDTITTGTSLLETVKMIERNGGLVSKIIVLVDREEGGFDIIKNQGYDISSVFKVSSMFERLRTSHLIDEFVYEKAFNYVNVSRNKFVKELGYIEGEDVGETADTNDQNEKYSVIFRHKLRIAVLELMIEKKSTLCLSLDTSSWQEGKKILEECGEYIIMVKTHVELYEDYTEEFNTEIQEMAKKHRFFVMEDRKLGDVSGISWKQMMFGRFKIDDWASFITIHGLTAESCFDYYERQWNSNNVPVNISPCMVVQMNSTDNFIDTEYTSKCLDILDKYEVSSPIIICQCLPNVNSRLKATPGVLLDSNDEIDARKYRTIEQAIVYEGNHIIIVGSGILYSDDIQLTAMKYAEKSWQCFNEAFPDLIKEANMFFEELKEQVEKK